MNLLSLNILSRTSDFQDLLTKMHSLVLKTTEPRGYCTDNMDNMQECSIFPNELKDCMKNAASDFEEIEIMRLFLEQELGCESFL